jgi:hypothetical protein
VKWGLAEATAPVNSITVLTFDDVEAGTGIEPVYGALQAPA